MLSGIIMSCYSVGAIVWVLITKAIANPNNLKPDDHQKVGDVTEDFFMADGPVVANVPRMLRTLGFVYMVMIILAVVLVNKRVMPEVEQKHLPMMDGFVTTGKETEFSNSVMTMPSKMLNTVSPHVQKMRLNNIVKRAKPPLRKLTVKQALAHRTFWHIFAMLLCSMAFTDFMKP